MNLKGLYLAAAAFVVTGCASTGVDRGNFGSFQRSLNNTSYGYEVVADPTNTFDAPVEKFEVRPGDCSANEDWSDCKNDRERSELSERNKRTRDGDEYWYSWKIYFPEDYTNVYPTKVASGQFHQQGGHAIWMFQNGNGGYHLDEQILNYTRGYYPLISEQDLRGQWHHIQVHARWKKDNSGFMRVWVNGDQKVDYSGQTMTAKAVYFKYGVYRSFMSRYQNRYDVDEVPAQTVYFSEVFRANTRAELPQ